MTYKKFYFGKLNAQILKKIDAEHKTKMKQLIKEINQGSWTEKQKKRQKRSIISNIAPVSYTHLTLPTTERV